MRKVDISHTVKAAELLGGVLWKDLDTGEVTLELPDVVADPEEVEKVLEEFPLIPEVVATTVQSRKSKK